MSDAPHTARREALRRWAGQLHDRPPETLRLAPAAGDASFRRYYRLRLDDATSRILMDAPPEQEDSRPFVAIAEAWRAAGLPVPAIHARDLTRGFLELEDLGDAPLHTCLGAGETSDAACYDDAQALLGELQNRAPGAALPVYDAALLGRELDLFPEWCLTRLLDMPPPPGWTALRERLIEVALAQPQVVVHRDFDAMNLMRHHDRLWLIDFQDAVRGPLSYDLISLLRGRYRRFSREAFRERVEGFRRRAVLDGRLSGQLDAETFLFQADAMAAQRSLKVLGIFCRLTLRDGRQGYLARLPRFLDHLRDSLAPWAEFAAFDAWLADTFTPTLTAALDAHREPTS
ncbi:phosphotransferase [Modicisalibacter tunisiensis]|uniref:aminoglycoside phosphotransferase family protein n=1 Tax=Modicisalibacter tunisiensis TaxID=390637 RepID=UPI001CCB3F8E|nr:phosphotransferase [Modicisalibacter tunisiensis]MBZ9540113.1 phosphotransferase [Modicisalibacter tunisiensis]